MLKPKSLAELAAPLIPKPLIPNQPDRGDGPRNRLNAALRKFAADRPHSPVESDVLAELLYTLDQTSTLCLSCSEAAVIALIVEFASTLTPDTVKAFRM